MRRGPLSWLGALLALYLLGPIVAFAVRFAEPGAHGFDQRGLWDAFGTSVLTASISTVVVAVVGIPLAHRLATSEGRTARLVGLLVQLPLALPPVMSGIVLIYVIGPYTPIGALFGGRLTDSIAGVVIAQTFVSAPFLVIGARSAFRAVDPDLDGLAATLGHRPVARFLRVWMPAASDGIRAALVLTWLRALGEYGATALIAYHPYTLPVFTNVQFQGAGLPTTQAPTALALGIALVAVLVGAFRVRRRRRAVTPPDPREPSVREPVTVAFDVRRTLPDFELRAAVVTTGHRLAIVGPSGAGKTQTLRAVAGTTIGATEVVLGGVAVERLRPEDRGVGSVPQGGLLFPRRTVWEQVVFGVGTDPRVASWWLRTLRIDGLADRWPDELSGGERQRVALAQTLSREPALVLLDEPFSALDGPVRDELRAEFRRLQRERGLSTVVVTHDPDEAALLADEVVVLADGTVLQQGDRAEVYRAPSSPTVARLLGVRNVLDGRNEAGAPTRWGVRAEDVRIAPDGPLEAVVVDVADLGGAVHVELRLDDGQTLLARTPTALAPPAGSRVRVWVDPAAVVVWPA
jgi:ABC-type sulfate/molybdate transport systems ATPase subunit/ABC-type sulfate transport system permease component